MQINDQAIQISGFGTSLLAPAGGAVDSAPQSDRRDEQSRRDRIIDVLGNPNAEFIDAETPQQVRETLAVLNQSSERRQQQEQLRQDDIQQVRAQQAIAAYEDQAVQPKRDFVEQFMGVDVYA